MKLIMVLIAGTAIFALSAILKILLNKISQKYSSWNKLNKLFPAIGTVLWTGFVFWGTGILFREKHILSIYGVGNGTDCCGFNNLVLYKGCFCRSPVPDAK